MSTRSRVEPTGSVRELGLPARAVGALTRAGITTVEQLSALTRRELAAVPGLGPAMVAAVRAVVPEPVAVGLWPLPDEDDAPPSPAIPSFDSLRAPRRRTAFDVLVPEEDPGEPAGPSVVAPSDGASGGTPEEDEEPTPAGPPPSAAPAAPAPRPAEWADLAALGARGVRAAAVLPWRVTGWWLRLPLRVVGRLRTRP
ncbi:MULTISPECIES: DNA-directed RNA polymerase subunit alpha C-terminal domain-containing protein [unclassified Geodermatophilus]